MPLALHSTSFILFRSLALSYSHNEQSVQLSWFAFLLNGSASSSSNNVIQFNTGKCSSMHIGLLESVLCHRFASELFSVLFMALAKGKTK